MRRCTALILIALLVGGCTTPTVSSPTATTTPIVAITPTTAATPTPRLPTPTPLSAPSPPALAGPTTPTPPTASQPQLGQRTKTTNCRVDNALPDGACTPGAVFASATKEQICTSGYASSVRNVTTAEKNQVYAEYGVQERTPGEYEIDHLVSLELGGSNDIANLWPEAAEPRPGFHEKDQVENFLHDQICAGTISVQEAQYQIATNWLDVFTRRVSPAVPAASASPRVTTVTPIRQPATTTASSSGLTASASVSDPAPRQNQSVTVTAKLVDGSGTGVPGASMSTTWHYKTTASTCVGGPTNVDGIATCSRDIGGASIGYSVRVDVVLTLGGQTYTTSTSFTPK